MIGATISLSDKTGANFSNNSIIGNKSLGLVDYMRHATGGGIYDFKINGIADRPKGESRTQYMYRGGVVDGVPGLGGNNGMPTIASGRDIGNVGAGFVAGSNGLSWNDARLGFDALQSYEQGMIASEGQTTQLAERIGYDQGNTVWAKDHPWQNLFLNDTTLGVH